MFARSFFLYPAFSQARHKLISFAKVTFEVTQISFHKLFSSRLSRGRKNIVTASHIMVKYQHYGSAISMLKCSLEGWSFAQSQPSRSSRLKLADLCNKRTSMLQLHYQTTVKPQKVWFNCGLIVVYQQE